MKIKIPVEYIQDKRFMVARDRLKISFFILIIYFVLTIIHIGCPIRFATGISCPGCGMTRATLAVLHFDLKSAFFYHPLFMITPFMICLFLFEAYFNPKFYKVSWIIIIVLFLIVYIIRLIFMQNDVVVIDMYNGIVIKLIHQIYVGGFK